MKALMATADDFGLSLEVNEAVERAHREGILTAASLMVAGPAAADAVRRARALPGLRVGLHLVLVEGLAASPPEALPRLAGPDGRLRSDMARLGLEIAASRRVRNEVRGEIERQFSAFRATGLELDHVNAHKHFHVHPVLARQLIDIGRGYAPFGLRVPLEPRRVLQAIEPTPAQPAAAIMAPWAMLLRRWARAAGIATADHVFGLRWSGGMTEARLAGLLGRLPEGLSEIYLHPAVADSFAGSAPGYRYGDELRALLSPRCAEAIATGGIVRGSYRRGGPAAAGKKIDLPEQGLGRWETRHAGG